LLERYHLRDVAFKVVGVGSVGTFCAIGLLMSDDEAPLLLQIKEAQESVLAPYAGASEYPNHGQRVVVGQRMLQAATDIFLGWTAVPMDGRHFYVRRLKDQRLADVGARLEAALPFYAALCGRTLSRAHARAGDSAAISAYIGEGTEFDEAIVEFAMALPIRRTAIGRPSSTRSRQIGSARPRRGLPRNIGSRRVCVGFLLSAGRC
jgi:uncharacterized protein (DUF2252 family)